jgi:hypothetical protein
MTLQEVEGSMVTLVFAHTILRRTPETQGTLTANLNVDKVGCADSQTKK